MTYERLKTLPVKIGNLIMGNHHSIVLQTMVNTDTMDTFATVEQCIQCIKAGASIVRITTPSKKEAENLFYIKKLLKEKGYTTPLVADIHFTPNVADIAAEIVEKVRINPGNYLDKKKFEIKTYSDQSYLEEMHKIEEKFIHFLHLCEKYQTAIRIGVNHGSLSDRIMNRYGDTPIGMVESAMEFLRIARKINFQHIVLSMKSSNPLVMVHAYRLLVLTMKQELGECYPLHLGVTEAGDGEDGRIKSAIGIGTLLEEGIGDTIRVSLTESPEVEIPVCKNIVSRYMPGFYPPFPQIKKLSYNPLSYKRQNSDSILNIGKDKPIVIVADFSEYKKLSVKKFEEIGYVYKEGQWEASDIAADYILTRKPSQISLPIGLKEIVPFDSIEKGDKNSKIPLYIFEKYTHPPLYTHIVEIDLAKVSLDKLLQKKISKYAILMFLINAKNNLQQIKSWCVICKNLGIENPIIVRIISNYKKKEHHILNTSIVLGGLLLDGFGDGICIHSVGQEKLLLQEENNLAFGILQATRTRITKTEYISCPSCGRTLFDLMETTAKIRQATKHLKGVKLAIMGCIVNGPGEMADADFGYVGSGIGSINLYKGKDIIKKNIPENIAVEELIQLLKENGVWKENK
ncbi:MAG: (E)-4-hydroxy-3-methylbut-2-enyl-diphosphate synthase [Chitinophagaceae bacterium]